MLQLQKKQSFKGWVTSGDPWVWFNAAAVSIAVVAVVGLLALLAVRGLGHFWPADVMVASYADAATGEKRQVIGEIVTDEEVSRVQLAAAGVELPEGMLTARRELVKFGNRDVTGTDFGWLLVHQLTDVSYPESVAAIERREWGSFYGYLIEVKEAGRVVAESTPGAAKNDAAWQALQQRIARANELHEQIVDIERSEIGAVNYRMEQLRLKQRALELEYPAGSPKLLEGIAELDAQRKSLDAEYAELQQKLRALVQEGSGDSVTMQVAGGARIEIPVAKIVHAQQPNGMSLFDKLVAYANKFVEFLVDDPREANTEGGIFPAIFGTVMMVLLMSVIVTPFGVVAAVYMHEYAKQGFTTRLIRIAVNNLAGVPSIVYGVFGLGFFVYFLGGKLDDLFFPEAAPAPVFGTPGLLWASLTLALLTVPVVIVATEEGLSRVPSMVRQGSLALGATKFETIWRVVLPMASPAMMTGLILAVARAAGEVAPLMLVGVVKLAPTLPLDGNFPFLHLERKFMHLGFHIYDVGFQSPNVEAARPLVYATAFLLVVVIVALNQSAIMIRNHLREKYKALEI